jgi:hypothetical protein
MSSNQQSSIPSDLPVANVKFLQQFEQFEQYTVGHPITELTYTTSSGDLQSVPQFNTTSKLMGYLTKLLNREHGGPVMLANVIVQDAMKDLRGAILGAVLVKQIVTLSTRRTSWAKHEALLQDFACAVGKNAVKLFDDFWHDVRVASFNFPYLPYI